jgi:hypothetical protein
LTSGRPRLRKFALASIIVVGACLAPTPALAHNIDERLVGSAQVGGERVEITTHGDSLPPASPVSAVSPRFAGISPSWCGTPRATDDIGNETGSLDDAKIHLVYAYPSDEPNRFSTYADMIQGDVNAIADIVPAQPGSTKAVRFDLGTSGGIGCVDITTVALPNDKAFYNNQGGGTFTKLIADVSPLFGFGWPGGYAIPPHPRNLLVYADRIVPGFGISGQGHRFINNAPADGPHNQGGLLAASFYNASRWDEDANAAEVALRRDISLHEVGHNLGAVQSGPTQDPDPPHGSGASHCYEEWDVMCYDDGGPYFDDGGSLVFSCGMPQLFDCGQDDYFRTPDPPAGTDGTYLATHWNLYDSAFLCPVAPATGCVPTNLAVPPSGGEGSTGTSPGTSSETSSQGTRRKKCGKKKRASRTKKKRCKRKRSSSRLG